MLGDSSAVIFMKKKRFENCKKNIENFVQKPKSSVQFSKNLVDSIKRVNVVNKTFFRGYAMEKVNMNKNGAYLKMNRRYAKISLYFPS